jgi:hypothetical protein
MPDREDVRAWMLEALREDLALGDEVDAALAADPDEYMLELDSKTAEFLLAKVEILTGAKLPAPADLGPEQYASLGSLIDVALKGVQ